MKRQLQYITAFSRQPPFCETIKQPLLLFELFFSNERFSRSDYLLDTNVIPFINILLWLLHPIIHHSIQISVSFHYFLALRLPFLLSIPNFFNIWIFFKLFFYFVLTNSILFVNLLVIFFVNVSWPRESKIWGITPVQKMLIIKLLFTKFQIMQRSITIFMDLSLPSVWIKCLIEFHERFTMFFVMFTRFSLLSSI